MGDPLSVASGLIAVVTATLQSSKILYETIQSFRNHRTAVLDLVRELKGLESVLSPLQDHACVDFQILIEQNSRRTRAETRTSLRDWAKLMYMNGDIVSFKELLAGYKGTITIALADANLRSSKVTLQVLNDYKNLICDTKLDLEKHLKDIDSKLQDIVSQGATTEAAGGQANLRKFENEKESTERCLEYLKHLLEEINGMSFQPVFTGSASNTAVMSISAGNMTLADSLTISTLKTCSYNLSDTIDRLESHRDNTEENLRLRSLVQDLNQKIDPGANRETLQNELESTKQCLSVCDRASQWASSGRVHVVEDISVGNDGKQICVSTLGDLFNIKGARAGHGSIQFFGSVSEGSLNDVLRSQNQRQYVRNEGTVDEGCPYGVALDQPLPETFLPHVSQSEMLQHLVFDMTISFDETKRSGPPNFLSKSYDACCEHASKIPSLLHRAQKAGYRVDTSVYAYSTCVAGSILSAIIHGRESMGQVPSQQLLESGRHSLEILDKMGHFWDHVAKMACLIPYDGKGEVVVRDLKGADKMDSGNYRAGEGPLRAFIAAIAAEFGDKRIYKEALDQLDNIYFLIKATKIGSLYNKGLLAIT
ncbi:hypothetical protein FOBRF1_014783 [Fusarium oxysporum]